MDVTILIATFGDSKWIDLAHERALPSAMEQDVAVVLHHGPTLHEARNEAAELASTEWLCYLDADDSLADGYIEAMSKSTGDLRAPAVSWVTEHSATEPVTLHNRNIEHMNPCVIGTLTRRDLFMSLGGFWDWPAWEDWHYYLRASRSGARIEHVPDAVYRAYMSAGSRNQSVQDAHRLHAMIKAAA